MSEYLADDLRVFDAGNYPDLAAAFTTSFTKSRRLQAMSIVNTFFKRFAQVIEARFSAGLWSCTSSGVLTFFPLPRFAGVTSTRYLLFGAKTP